MTLFKRAAIGVGLLVTSVLLLFIGLEVFVRITGLQPDFFYRLDAEVGATHIPNKRGWWVFRGGRQHIEINEHGYRDRERSQSKTPGTYRIALLGDSFVEAFQVSLDETLGALLERRLNEQCSGFESYEVLNFGVSGFGTGQELDTLKHRVLKFEPDLVLLFFYPSNDIYDNSQQLDPESNRLHYVLDDSGQLMRIPFNVADNQLKSWLRHHSKAFLFVRDRVLRLRALRRVFERLRMAQVVADPAYQASQRARQAQVDNQYAWAESVAIQEAWRVTEALIEENRNISQERKTQFGLVVVPSRSELEAEIGAAVRLETGLDVGRALRRTSEMCERLALSCLQLLPAFRASARLVDEIYLPLDGHWAAAGHSLVAGALFNWLTPSCTSQG